MMFVMMLTFLFRGLAADHKNVVDVQKTIASLGIPRMESSEISLHLAQGGNWTIQFTQSYDVKGLSEEAVEEFGEQLQEKTDPWHSCLWYRSWGTWGDPNRRHWKASGESNDALLLASFFKTFVDGSEYSSFLWDKSAFELTLQLPASEANEMNWTNGPLQTLLDLASDAFELTIMRFQGFTARNIKNTLIELTKPIRLTFTTDGIISADAPAEVSDDGKTMNLEPWKFISDPPAKWSIRIKGLGRGKSPKR